MTNVITKRTKGQIHHARVDALPGPLVAHAGAAININNMKAVSKVETITFLCFIIILLFLIICSVNKLLDGRVVLVMRL